ncbi:MAG: hypothetical protein LBU80_07625 [Rikenellaceae bacterium]|jgi:selenocysteine lyase/cysteine desulfurase|nr:hypothetical protein [Rikenellaceae bacterium]
MEKQKTTGVAHDEAVAQAVASLTAARESIKQLVEARKRDKLSFTRAANVAREVGDLIKVVSVHLNNPKTV